MVILVMILAVILVILGIHLLLMGLLEIHKSGVHPRLTMTGASLVRLIKVGAF
jgi:hypothetical protein